MTTITQLPDVATVLKQASSLDRQTVQVTGTYIKEPNKPAILAEPDDVVTSFVPGLISGGRSVLLRGDAADAVAQLLPSQGFSAGLDVRSGQVQITGVLQQLQDAPVTIDVLDAKVIPAAAGADDPFGYGSIDDE